MGHRKKKRSKIHAHTNFVILNFTLKINIMLLFPVNKNCISWQSSICSSESCIAVFMVMSKEKLEVLSLNLISLNTMLWTHPHKYL